MSAFLPIPGTTPVPLMQARPFQCRWPVETGEAGLFFCGEPTEPGAKPCWCKAHRAIGLGAGTPAERSAIRAGRYIAKAEAA